MLERLETRVSWKRRLDNTGREKQVGAGLMQANKSAKVKEARRVAIADYSARVERRLAQLIQKNRPRSFSSSAIGSAVVVRPDVMRDLWVLHSDGAAKSNQSGGGPAGAGALLHVLNGQFTAQGVNRVMPTSDDVVDSCSHFLGRATNNVAEYHGIILGLKLAVKRARQLNVSKRPVGEVFLSIRTDSKLCIDQIMNKSRTVVPELVALKDEVIRQFAVLRFRFGAAMIISLKHVPRNFAPQQAADRLANLAIDNALPAQIQSAYGQQVVAPRVSGVRRHGVFPSAPAQSCPPVPSDVSSPSQAALPVPAIDSVVHSVSEVGGDLPSSIPSLVSFERQFVEGLAFFDDHEFFADGAFLGRTLTRWPKKCLPLLIVVFRLLFQHMTVKGQSSGASAVRAWKAFSFFPLLCAGKPRRAGKRGAGCRGVLGRLYAFARGEFASLWDVAARSSHCGSRWPSSSPEKRALDLVRVGQLSRAVKALFQANQVVPSSEVLSQLQAKHPCRETDAPELAGLPEGCLPVELSRSEWAAALTHAPKLAAAGPSGWRMDWLGQTASGDPSFAAEAASAVDALFELCQSIVAGQVPLGVEVVLNSARLVAVSKSEVDVRPIAVSCPLRRLIGSALNRQLRPEFVDHFAPLQLGVGTKGGLEVIIHSVRGLLEHDPSLGVLRLDIRNAFNSVSRAAIRGQVEEHFPSLLPFFLLVYGGSFDMVKPLFFNLGAGEFASIDSQEGSQQGDPLGGFLFCLALQPVLVSLAHAFPGCFVRAGHDDISVVGPPSVLSLALEHVVVELRKIGLQIAPHKCAVFSPDPAVPLDRVVRAMPSTAADSSAPCVAPLSASSAAGVSSCWPPELELIPSHRGIVLFGVPIGAPDFASDVLLAKLEEATNAARVVARLHGRQAATLLLRSCIMPKLDYWWRTVSPIVSRPLAGKFYCVLREALADILDLEIPVECVQSDSSALSRQVALPIRLGGLGFVFPSTTLAFAASFAFAACHPAFPPLLSGLFERCIDVHMPLQDLTVVSFFELDPASSSFAVFAAIWHTFIALLRNFERDHLGGEKIPAWDEIRAAARPGGAFSQKALFASKALSERLFLVAELVKDDEASQARLVSAGGKFAGLWLSSIPWNAQLSIDDEDFRVGVAYRLGLPLPTSPLWEPRCPYPSCKHRDALDPAGHHFSSCPSTAGARTRRHDSLKCVWRSVCSAAGVTAFAEVSGIFPPSARRPDLWCPWWPVGDNAPRAFDVVISDPSAPSYSKHAAKEPLFVASQAERRKFGKYGDIAQRLQFAFVPLSFETFGAWGREAVKALAELAECAVLTRDVEVAAYGRYHRAIIAVALLRATAAWLREGTVKQLFPVAGPGAAALGHDSAWVQHLEDQRAGLCRWKRLHPQSHGVGGQVDNVR